MQSRTFVRSMVWVLSLASVFTGCVLVWMSTSFRLHEPSGRSLARYLANTQPVETSRPISPPHRLNQQERRMSTWRVGLKTSWRPPELRSRERKSGVRIFRKSGRLLFTPTNTTSAREHKQPAVMGDPSGAQRFLVQDQSHQTAFSFETDVLVFLHIQKTGGTALELHLLDIESTVPCVCDGVKYVYSPVETRNPKQCKCLRSGDSIGEQWLFSRFTFSWVCGVHADWTRLSSCVPKIFESRYGAKPRTFLLFTILRQPVDRFLSEYEHVARGANWDETMHHRCRGSRQNLTSCYNSSQNMHLSIDSFLNCPWNLAINRQSRMLADMTELSDCYHDTSQTVVIQEALLVRAKQNLLNIEFFGLTEFQIHTQLLFEKTFGLHFKHQFKSRPLDKQHAYKHNISNAVRGQVARANRLDMYLYSFAKTLFLHRLEEFHISEPGSKFS